MRAQETLKRIGTAIALAALIAYTAFHIFTLFGDEISTVVVSSTTEQKVVAMDGYIFRDEEILYSKYGGAIDYIASDAQKVSIGQALANVYEKGNNASITGSIELLNRQISIIEAGTQKGLSLSDLPKVREDIASAHTEISKKLAGGELRNISGNIDALKIALSQESVITNENSSLRETLKKLIADKEHLRAAGGNSVQEVSTKSGYFYSKADGYEPSFSVATADSLTLESYLEIIKSTPDDLVGKNVYGKIATSSEWRFVCAVSSSTSQYFEEGGTYDIVFTENDDTVFPLTLQKKVGDGTSSSHLLIFECNRAPFEFDFGRHQNVQAIVMSVRGISVPKDAVHMSDGVPSVYILQGSVVRERRVRISFEGSDYYIVEDGVEKDELGSYLQSNDLLITEGENLFDGRILE